MTTEMDATKARNLQGEIMSMASQVKGPGIDGKEANLIAAEQIAKREGFSSARELRRAIGKQLLSDHKDPNDYKARYRKLADDHDVLPQDAIMMQLWGCAEGTLSGIRSRLKIDEGYGFKHTKAGFEVTNRPVAQPAAVPLPAPAAAVSSNGTQPALPTIELDASLSELRQIRSLLEQLISIWS